MSNTSRLVMVVILCCLAIGSLSLISTAQSEYTMSVDDAVDVPEQTVEIDQLNAEFDVDSFVVRDAGESITVDVAGPDEIWVVEILDTDGSQESFVPGEGSESVTIGAEDTEELDPGTYALALETGSYEAVIPLVINGYDIDLDYDTDVSTDEDIEVTATLTQTDATTAPAGVELVVWDGADDQRITLSETDDLVYEETFELDEGTYEVYAAVDSGSEIEGFPVSNAIEDGPEITVTTDNNGDDDSGGDDTGSSDDGGSDNGAAGGGAGGEGPSVPSISPSDVNPPADVEVVTDIRETVQPTEDGSTATFGGFTDSPVATQAVFDNPDIESEIRTRDYDTTPSEIESPPGNTVSVSEIVLAPEYQDESATLRFDVENARHSDLETATLDTEELTVWRHDGSTWEPLETRTVGETQVEATTPGFSYFAITDTDDHESDDEVDSATDTDTEDPTDDSIPGFGILAGSLALVGMLILAAKR